MAQRLTLEQIAHVARLARLAMSEDEMRQMEKHINNLMAQFERLQELDTTGVEPTAHSFPVYNVMREDEVRPSLSQDEILANAPDQRDGCLLVPIIVEE
jgi:aspartyl-tRNA(Asn)/glutamyl-tRNA(Gln) amidotransferase subunit C